MFNRLYLYLAPSETENIVYCYLQQQKNIGLLNHKFATRSLLSGLLIRTKRPAIIH